MAIKHHLMVIVSLALIQNETETAHKYVRELVGLDWTVLEGAPCELVEFLFSECVADESVDHETLLKQVFAQLPQELGWLSSQYDWAVTRGYLWKGIRAIMWGRDADGRAHFAHAVKLGAGVDESLIQLTTYHLLGYETNFGTEAVMKVLSALRPLINQVAGRGGDRLEASYLINRAFEGYRGGVYQKIPAMVMHAWKKDPAYLGNRGVLSIFLRSIKKTIF